MTIYSNGIIMGEPIRVEYLQAHTPHNYVLVVKVRRERVDEIIEVFLFCTSFVNFSEISKQVFVPDIEECVVHAKIEWSNLDYKYLDHKN